MAVIRETRNVSNFDRVVMAGAGDIRLEQGEVESLVIEADESVLPHLKSEVVGGRLELGPKSWMDGLFMLRGEIIYHLTMKNIHSVSISGSGSLNAENINTDQLKLSISGSASMKVNHLESLAVEIQTSGSGRFKMGGAVPKLDIHISGSSTVDASALESQEVSVRISGSGEVSVNAQKRLAVRISGSARVRYVGEPQVEQHISGVGSIEQLK